ncbi:MAG: hypothetical protein CME63_06700 [Halobacteriovoraceae bacterium]|nr:hypothetical protein [Halobacteriovoraceae bacterium]
MFTSISTFIRKSSVASLIALTGFLAAPYSQAATIAIIDSGTDMLHNDISPKAWINPVEIAGNSRDEDGNGYQDDIHGWNFAEGNAEVIDYSYLGTLTEDIRRFFQIQTDAMLGTITEEDLAWARAQLQDENFIKQISIYGNFMHGTHVGGIAIEGVDEAKLLAVKLIPTEVKLPGQEDAKSNAEQDKGVKMFLLKQALGALAKQQMLQMEEIAAYVAGHKSDVANGSFGTGWPQATTIVKTIAQTVWKDITEEEVAEAAHHFFAKLIEHGEMMTAAAPNSLFVFAAGNDGLDNDTYPASPTNLQSDNVISVAATLSDVAIAPFSNYGKTMVDVAAPGVAIESAVPGNNYLKVSGPSQAAPFVAQVATAMKSINEKLTPGQMRTLIMETVDKKAFLADKVVTGGMVNRERAVRAAELALTHSLADAIAQSKKEVKAQRSTKKNISLGNLVPDLKDFVLPLQNSFIIRK